MPREFSRAQRVAEQIQRELADLIVREVNDARLHHLTISGVQVSRDLARAKVYITPELGASADEILNVLNRASGFLRHGLAQRIHTRAVPRLDFIYDATLDRADRISNLIDKAVSEGAGESDPGEPTTGEGNEH